MRGGRRPDFGEDATRRVGANVADTAVVSFAKDPSGTFFDPSIPVRPTPPASPLPRTGGPDKEAPPPTILSVEDDDEAVERSRARGPRPPRRPMVGISGTEGGGVKRHF